MTDYVQRFLFEDLSIRGRLLVLERAWQQMLAGRRYAANIVELLGHTVAVCVLLGVHHKNERRITLQVRGDGPVSLLVADCAPGLKIRGMAVAATGADGNIGELFGSGRLALTLEDAASGQLYQSLVPLEGETLAEVFQHYLSQSEQTQSHLLLYASATALCGLLLEKLPDADARDPQDWAQVIERAARLTLADALAQSPSSVLVRLFGTALLRVFALDPIEYYCPFDPTKVRDVLRSLGRAECEAILAEQGEVIIHNEMRNHEYRFGRAELDALFVGG